MIWKYILMNTAFPLEDSLRRLTEPVGFRSSMEYRLKTAHSGKRRVERNEQQGRNRMRLLRTGG